MHERAGKLALPEDLIDPSAVVDAYFTGNPDPDRPEEQVAFGTSGHRGSSLDNSFNESHIIATTAAIVEYRKGQGITGPLYIGRDTHALSEPAQRTALEVLAAAGVDVRIDARDGFTPTPAISHSILRHNGAGSEQGARTRGPDLADGIVVTPSHNPPRDGGFKYNPPHGGPADTDATQWIARRANQLMREGVAKIERMANPEQAETIVKHDYLTTYVDDLESVIDIDAIREAGVRIGADPLGGAAVAYWAEIGERYNLDLTVVNPKVDPRWPFMTLDWDGKIRMDCSSPYAMASLLEVMRPESGSAPYDIATGNDADADRHGIVTPDGGLLNPNHFLAVAIEYLFTHREQWAAGTAVGKTLVSSALIDRVVAGLGRDLLEVPVGFKWFVPGLLDGSVGFGGEESAGASFLRRDGSVWSTDKDGITLALLASEMLAVTGRSPWQLHLEQVEAHGMSWYSRVDAEASRAQKARLGALAPESVRATELAGQPITAKLVNAPGNGEAIGGLKVTTKDAWFAARPSGTEDVYKIYAESFVSEDHLGQVLEEATSVVTEALQE